MANCSARVSESMLTEAALLLVDCTVMGEIVSLGKVTCPSGCLVVLDGGMLGLWSGSKSPSDIDPAELTDDPALADAIASSVDFRVAGADAAQAARTFERRPMPDHYDIPAASTAQWIKLFEEHCHAQRLNAHLEPYVKRVPHRERAVRAAQQAGQGFTFTGMPAVAVSGLPAGQRFDVIAEAAEGEFDGWKQISVKVSGAPAASSRELGIVGVDRARLAFADVAALDDWQHEESLDGLADVLFWGGPNAAEASEHFGVSHVDIPGEENSYGWTNLPVHTAWQRATTIQAWKDNVPGRKLGLDFRPHSHHWQVMSQVRAAETSSGSISVGGAEILFAMTSWGDGYFPAFADYGSDGSLVAVRVELFEE